MTNTSLLLLARIYRTGTNRVFEQVRGVPTKDHFHTIPGHHRPHVTNLRDQWKTRGTVQDLARPLGLIAGPRNRGEMDKGAIQLGTDRLNRQMRGNRTITIFAIDKTSKLDMGFVGFFFSRGGSCGRET